MPIFTNTKSFSEHLKKTAEIAVEKVIIEAYDSLVFLSPEDEGTFKGNWNISSGVEDLEFKENKTNRMVDLGKVRNAARNAMKGQSIYITNNAPYARRLEYGYSKKSQGMLRITTQKLKRRA